MKNISPDLIPTVTELQDALDIPNKNATNISKYMNSNRIEEYAKTTNPRT